MASQIISIERVTKGTVVFILGDTAPPKEHPNNLALYHVDTGISYWIAEESGVDEENIPLEERLCRYLLEDEGLQFLFIFFSFHLKIFKNIKRMASLMSYMTSTLKQQTCGSRQGKPYTKEI